MSIPLQFASLYDGQEVFVKKKKKRWEDNIRKRTGLEFANPRGQWRTEKKRRKLVVKSSVVPQRPARLRDR